MYAIPFSLGPGHGRGVEPKPTPESAGTVPNGRDLGHEDPALVARHALRQTLLADLSCLGEVWIEIVNPVLRLGFSASLPACINAAGVATGPNDGADGLYLLPDHWNWLYGPRGIEALEVEDDTGTTLLRLMPRASIAGFTFARQALLRTHGGEPRARLEPSVDVPARLVRDASEHAALKLLRDGSIAEPTWTALDIAELSGLLPLFPRRLRAAGWAMAVDPTLVSTVLEIFAEQCESLWLSTGNAGVLTRRMLNFCAVRNHRCGTRLDCDQMTLKLDHRALDSAWVLLPSGAQTRQLRLYDADGQAAGILDAQPCVDGREPSLWKRLIDALLI